MGVKNLIKSRSSPGEVKNFELIKSISGNSVELKENLLQHHDYEAVSEKIYSCFKDWYGVDHDIKRILKVDPANKKKLVLDLYPG